MRVVWRALIGIVVVFLGIWLISNVYYYYYPPRLLPAGAGISGGYGWVNAFVIDLTGNKIFSQDAVLNGDDGVLVVHMSSNPNEHNEDIIKSKQVLMALDVNHDGILDARDPAYQRMELAFFDKANNGALTHTLLYKMGLRAILLDSQLVAQAVRENPSSQADTVGVAIFSDGSRRMVNQISIYEPYLTEQQQ